MFKIGIYSKQLTAIAVLLFILTVAVIGSSFDMNPANNPKKEVIVKSFESNDEHTCVDPDHTSCDGLCECDGMECDASVYNDAVEEIVYKHIKDEEYQSVMQYVITPQDNANKLVLTQGNRIIHVFDRAYSPNQNLFKVLDRDNW